MAEAFIDKVLWYCNLPSNGSARAHTLYAYTVCGEKKRERGGEGGREREGEKEEGKAENDYN